MELISQIIQQQMLGGGGNSGSGKLGEITITENGVYEAEKEFQFDKDYLSKTKITDEDFMKLQEIFHGEEYVYFEYCDDQNNQLVYVNFWYDSWYENDIFCFQLGYLTSIGSEEDYINLSYDYYNEGYSMVYDCDSGWAYSEYHSTTGDERWSFINWAVINIPKEIDNDDNNEYIQYLLDFSAFLVGFEPCDGYSKVEVEVQPRLEAITITENGTYTVPDPPTGFEPGRRLTFKEKMPDKVVDYLYATNSWDTVFEITSDTFYCRMQYIPFNAIRMFSLSINELYEGEWISYAYWYIPNEDCINALTEYTGLEAAVEGPGWYPDYNGYGAGIYNTPKVPPPTIQVPDEEFYSDIPKEDLFLAIETDMPDGYNQIVVNTQGIIPKGTINITKNGSYDVNEYATALVAIGEDTSQPLETKDVNFYDYDGTLLYSYTLEEVQALEELPILPAHFGLICQGWNWTLEDIKNNNQGLDVGANYITDDGKTRLYISIISEDNMSVPIYFFQGDPNCVIINWGDGAEETINFSNDVSAQHTYSKLGNYIITLNPIGNTQVSLGHGDDYGIMGSIQKSNNIYRTMLKKVEIGQKFSHIAKNTFRGCYSLESITIPRDMGSIYTAAFYECFSLITIVMPPNISQIGSDSFTYCYSLKTVALNKTGSIYSNAFYDCRSLKKLIIPKEYYISSYACRYCYSISKATIPSTSTTIPAGLFEQCFSLTSIVIPDNITKIEREAFYNCVCMRFYDFTQHTRIPTLSSTDAFYSIPSDCEIRVPAALYDEWVVATNWSTYADHIVAV